MKTIVLFTATFLLSAGGACAGTLTAPDGTAPPPSNNGSWIDNIAGRPLLAVDGSSVTLTPNEGGFTLNAVTPDGASHDMAFNMLGDNLGSISEGGDKVTGVFHIAGNAIEADFGDGRTETIAINAAGGVSMYLDAPGTHPWCMKWYPQGHSFDEADKRAALVEYAHKLGIPAPKSAAAVVTRAGCIDADAHPHMLANAAAAPIPVARPHKNGTGEKGKVIAVSDPIFVKTSEVHLIDAPEAAPTKPVAAQPAQAITAPAPLASAQPPKLADRGPAPRLMQSHGASSCLTIDNDGTNWGFRNSCDYPVQFSWCLQNGSDRSTACGTGTGTGSLEGKGFAALLPGDAPIEADNQFRWVACHGGRNVAAQLDRADPPAGRCVIASSE